MSHWLSALYSCSLKWIYAFILSAKENYCTECVDSVFLIAHVIFTSTWQGYLSHYLQKVIVCIPFACCFCQQSCYTILSTIFHKISFPHWHFLAKVKWFHWIIAFCFSVTIWFLWSSSQGHSSASPLLQKVFVSSIIVDFVNIPKIKCQFCHIFFKWKKKICAFIHWILHF